VGRTPGQISNGQISNQTTDQIDQRPTYADIVKNLHEIQKRVPPADATTKETITGSHIEIDSPAIPTNKPWVVITKKSQKGTPAKIEEPFHYRDKRLILSPSDGVLQTFNPMRIRNAINDRFSAELSQTEPVVATVTKSYSQQSIVLTTTDQYSAKFLMENRKVWQSCMPSSHIQTDEKWGKIVVHGIPIEPFDMDGGIQLLQNEIETFNKPLKVKRIRWLSSEENMRTKKSASIVVHLQTTQMVEKAVAFRLKIAGLSLKAQKYQEIFIQCERCQKAGRPR
jgi:hypothetical protein